MLRPVSSAEAAALAALDADALAADVAALVQAPSQTGDERPALERLAELATRQGLAPELVEHDLAALRAHPGHPGEEAPRDELLGLTATVAGARPGAPRLCLNGHVDVVGPGDGAWERPPWSGAVDGGFVHGRGSADMKGGVVAALHAVGAVARTAGAAPAAEVVLQAVASEEDGGLGTFAALERDDAFAACLIPEPTAFTVACVQGGALTFRGVVPGRAAHAAVRLEGVSALDRYVAVHAALSEHEGAQNADVAHPLMRELPLPYPLLVGRLEAGRWSSSVPDRAVFEGRVGVRVEDEPAQARAALEAAVHAVCPDAELTWEGGQFEPGATDPGDPFVRLVQAAGADELGAPPPAVGVPYGSDMRLFAARGIPCVMFGTGGLERAHGVDERVRVDELLRVARVIVRVLLRFRTTGAPGRG
jgi:acetylornithine deacetylase